MRYLEEKVRVKLMALRPTTPRPLDDRARIDQNTIQVEEKRLTSEFQMGFRGQSLAGRRLPQFYLVSFWIDDPGKLPVLGIVDLLENVAAFFAQDFDEGVEIFHAVVDHESCSAGRKLVTLRRANRPDGCSGNRLAFAVGPGESRATPFLDIDSEVPLVPRL